MAENDAERTEAPTARRRDEARQQGNIARSPDLTAALILLAGIILLHVFGMAMMGHLRNALESQLAGSPDVADNATRVAGLSAQLWHAGHLFVLATAPIVLSVAAVALLANLGQVGFLFSTRPLELDFSKLSPLRGLQSIFSARGGMRLAMSLAKVGLIAGVAVWLVIDLAPQIVKLAELPVGPMFAAASGMIYGLALKLAMLLLLLALADYGFQYWQRERDLRMTEQELKEEFKRMEGDPLIRQRRSRVARALMLQRIGQAVPKADVIVTNPTHFAIALRYERDKMKAPKVVAKGADLLAMRIRQLAMLHGVPMVERKDLARALYKSVNVGQEVPPQFYTAVAEVLAYVYRLAGRKTA